MSEMGFSLVHEMELRAYFARDAPEAPGARSHFGAICERMARRTNPETTEQPTPGTPWTEIPECRGFELGGPINREEDELIAYIDARRSAREVGETLDRLSTTEQDELRAHYEGASPRGMCRVAEALLDAARGSYARARVSAVRCR